MSLFFYYCILNKLRKIASNKKCHLLLNNDIIPHMHIFGILSSGVPNTFRHIHNAFESKILPNANIGLVICNRPNAPIFTAARELQVPYKYIQGKGETFDNLARDSFIEAGVQTVLLIGYES